VETIQIFCQRCSPPVFVGKHRHSLHRCSLSKPCAEITVVTAVRSLGLGCFALAAARAGFRVICLLGSHRRTDSVVRSLCVVEVFESDTANGSFLPSSSYGEDTDGVATPARPRTTEDLFAAIHRYCRNCPSSAVRSSSSLKNYFNIVLLKHPITTVIALTESTHLSIFY